MKKFKVEFSNALEEKLCTMHIETIDFKSARKIVNAIIGDTANVSADVREITIQEEEL